MLRNTQLQRLTNSALRIFGAHDLSREVMMKPALARTSANDDPHTARILRRRRRRKLAGHGGATIRTSWF